MCEYHEEVYASIPPEVIKIIESHTIEMNAIAKKIGSLIGPYVFTHEQVLEEGETPLPASEKPIALTRIELVAGFIYAAAWMAGESSPTPEVDRMYDYVFVNGVNDGNAYVCHNKSKGN